MKMNKLKRHISVFDDLIRMVATVQLFEIETCENVIMGFVEFLEREVEIYSE